MTEDEIWRRAELWLSPTVWDAENQAVARAARAADRQFFNQHRKAICRIRRVRPGESATVDQALAADPEATAWMVVIHHARRNDRRVKAGVGWYVLLLDRRDDVATIAREEARAMVGWYSVLAEDYPFAGTLDQRVRDLLMALGIVLVWTGEPWAPSAAGGVAL